MKILIAIWQFIKKHFRWLLPAVWFTIWLFVPEKNWLDFFAGAILAFAIWYAYAKYLKPKE